MQIPATIRALIPADWPAVQGIYAEGIATHHATFETTTPTWESWDAGHLPHTRFVAVLNEAVAGWIALCSVSSRQCYGGVAEISYYVGSAHRGQGVATALLQAAIDSSEANGVWTLTASVFPENTASIRLLASAGFRLVGRRERIGRMGGVWRDTLLYERRSGVV